MNLSAIGGGPEIDPGDASYAFGPFQLSAGRELLLHKGKRVRVGSRALSILSTLIERRGELVSKEELVASVWPNTHVEEGNLRVQITALRRILGDSSDMPRFIVNVTGRGYKFVADVQRVFPDSLSAPVGQVTVPARNTLPAAIANMIGREQNLEAVRLILERSRHVTIAGAGGIGKTTLALAAAHQLKQQFRDGAHFIDLAAVSDPGFVPFAVASAVRIAIDRERPVQSLVSGLARDEVLLLFDNCEHLIDAVAPVVESLLRGSPGIRVLATSHEPLGTEGERVYRLSSLDLPSGVEDLPLRKALAYPAVELFVEYMDANDDALTIGDADVPFIVEICRRLDGLPLAIEIAASRAGALGIAELAARLDDRFNLLTDGRRTVATRHQTLRNMLDWSHDNLGNRDRAVLRRISVFAGEFTLEAAGLVAGDELLNAESITAAVSSLLSKSLLMQTSRGSASTFRLLDSTRLYALERLGAAGEMQRVRQLHVHYLCDLLRQAELDWRMSPVPAWTDTYRRHIDDIRTALSFSFGPGGDQEGGVVLTSLALPLAMQLGLHDEFRHWMTVAIEHAAKLAKPLTVPELRLHLAQPGFAYNVGQTPDLIMARAVELSERTGLDRHRMEPLVQISSIHISIGQYAAALPIGERALALAQSSGDEYAVLSASRVMAQVAHYAGQHDRAMQLANAVLRHPVRNIPYTYGFMHTDRRLSMRGILLRSLWISGRADEAARVAAEGLAVAEDAGPVALAQFLGLAAVPMYLWSGSYDEARRLTHMLAEHSERYSFKYWGTTCRLFEDAVAFHDSGRQVAPATGELMAQTLSTVVGLAAPLPSVIQDTDWSAPELIRLRGEAGLAAGDDDVGEADLLHALDLARRHGALAWELRIATSLARAWANGHRHEDGAGLIESTIARFSEGWDTADMRAAIALLAHING